MLNELSLLTLMRSQANLVLVFSSVISINLLSNAQGQSSNYTELQHEHEHEHEHSNMDESTPPSSPEGEISKLFSIDQQILSITRKKQDTKTHLLKLQSKKQRYLREIEELSKSLKSDRVTLIKLLSIKDRVKSTRLVELLLNADGPLDQKRREVYLQAIFRSGSQRFKTLMKAKNELLQRQRAIELLSKKESDLNSLLEDQAQQLSVARQKEWKAISEKRQSLYGRNAEIISDQTKQQKDTKQSNYERAKWEEADRLPPSQGVWIDEYRKFRGLNLAKLYGGGIWILSNRGAPVYSVEQGFIVFAGQVTGWGSIVLIEHEYGYMSIYGNLSEVVVREGDKVSMQTLLGNIGSNAGREGLYFELRRGGESIHPDRWLSKKLSSVQ